MRTPLANLILIKRLARVKMWNSLSPSLHLGIKDNWHSDGPQQRTESYGNRSLLNWAVMNVGFPASLLYLFVAHKDIKYLPCAICSAGYSIVFRFCHSLVGGTESTIPRRRHSDCISLPYQLCRPLGIGGTPDASHRFEGLAAS